MSASTSGKLFTTTIGSGPTVITGLVKGELQDDGDVLDSTDSDSAPFTDTDTGCIGKKGTLEGHYRPEGMQYPALKMGTILTNLKIYPWGASADFFLFPVAICLDGTVSVETRGKVTYSIKFASKGTYTQPNDS